MLVGGLEVWAMGALQEACIDRDSAGLAFRNLLNRFASTTGSSQRNESIDEWTLVVHLTGHSSSRIIFEKLKRLASYTSGKPINIVIQITADKRELPLSGAINFCRVDKRIFVIRGGELRPLESSSSAGYKMDLQNLLSLACRLFPSERIGLFINSHGGGEFGMMADTGCLSIQELEQAVYSGLKDSPHIILDLCEIEDSMLGKNGTYHEVTCTIGSLVPQFQQSTYFSADILARICRLLS